MIEIKEIMTILPHAYPFLLVDRIVEIEPGKRIVGIKNVTYNEPFFPGHFPGRPIMPGVLIVEAMAQTAGVLVFQIPARGRSEKTGLLFGDRQCPVQKAGHPGRSTSSRTWRSPAIANRSGDSKERPSSTGIWSLRRTFWPC